MKPAVFAVVLAACGRDLPGPEVGTPFPEPLDVSFVLTDTEGQPFDFASRIKDRAALVFFGYTSCPDVCPLQMANIAAALETLPYRVTSNLQVIFVTTDPDRDTVDHLREWLDHFDPSFIGLTGSSDDITAAGRQMKMAPPIKEYLPDGNYLMGHSSFVVAFTPDGKGRFIYPGSTRQAVWASEIPRLVAWKETG